MRLQILAPLLLWTVLAGGCASRKVDVRLNGRPTESLRARASRSEGLWTVDLDLPLGQWRADLPDDGLAARVLDVDGRPHARWDASGDRLLARPFRVRLRPAQGEGAPIWIEVRGRLMGQGMLQFTLYVLTGGSLGIAYRP